MAGFFGGGGGGGNEPPAGTYNMLGIGGLLTGLNAGMQAADELQLKREEVGTRKMMLQNELETRRNAQSEAERFHTGELQNKRDWLDFLKSQAGKVGSPITDDAGNVVGYQTGKGGISKAPIAAAASTSEAPETKTDSATGRQFYKGARGWTPLSAPKDNKAGAAAQEKKDTALGMLDSLSDQWDSLGTGATTAQATVHGSKLKVESVFPSTAAGQYDAAAQAFAGKLDHDLLGRVNDLTIANAKKAIPGFYDTPESKEKKLKYIRGIYSTAAKSPAAGGADQDDKTITDPQTGDKIQFDGGWQDKTVPSTQPLWMKYAQPKKKK